MKNRYQSLRIKQLDNKLKSKDLREIQMPQRGWIWEIRNSLGMSHKQLAKRLKVSAPAIAGLEKSEVRGAISLNSLRKVAKVMKCNFVYCLVPETSLEKIIEDQTLMVAGRIFNRINHSMKLEEQGLSANEKRKQLNELIDEVNRERKGRIWDYEV